MVALELVVIRYFWLLIICFLLSSCEKFYGIEDGQILAWTEKNSQYLTELASEGIRNEVNGEVQGLLDIESINGNFLSKDNESHFKEVIRNILNEATFPDKKIHFNLNVKSEYKSIYIVLYQDGYCAAFGDCVKTFLVYSNNISWLINEPNYTYKSTKVTGWYILKVLGSKE